MAKQESKPPKWLEVREGEWLTRDPDEMQEMRDAIRADMEACPMCTKRSPDEMMPSHNKGFVDTNRAITYRCESFCRWFNPETREMEGKSECTCSDCF